MRATALTTAARRGSAYLLVVVLASAGCGSQAPGSTTPDLGVAASAEPDPTPTGSPPTPSTTPSERPAPSQSPRPTPTSTTQRAPEQAAEATPRPPPWSLTVDAAAIDQPVVPGGLTAEGTINPDRGQLIWFTGYDRVEPGEVGTAVLSGHVSYEGVPDVFADLHRVASGDEVVMRRGDGSAQSYVVTEVDIVDKAALQRDVRVWGDQRETRRLVLVTCDDELGFREDGHRAANLVVIAEPVEG